MSNCRGARSTMALAPVAIGLMCLTAPLRAQTIHGQVLDSLSGMPLPGGFAVLVTVDDRELARTLTDAAGHFRFPLPSDELGPFRIRSERIGYYLAVTDWLSPEDAASQEVVLYTRPLAVRLSALDVRGATECRMREDLDQRTVIVWEEASKALAATRWTAQHQQYRVLSHLYQRDVDLGTGRVVRQREGSLNRLVEAWFASREPEELLRDGYVRLDEAGATYHAPDLDVLRHDSFVATHCFRLVEPEDRSDALVGIAFQPTPRRRLPDVAGTLWLDRSSWQLRFLEYHYTNLPTALRTATDTDNGRGRVEFGPLATGEWIVRRWDITTPTGFREERVTRFDRFLTPRVVSVREAGGEVLAVADSQGTLLYVVELAELLGSVFDSSAHPPRPLAQGTVSVRGTWFGALTDGQGRFRLAAPLEGSHEVVIAHPRLDSLPFTPAPRTVTLERGRTDTVQLVIPSVHAVLAERCPGGTFEEGRRAVLGSVRDAETGEPASNATVVAVWQDSGRAEGRTEPAMAKAEEDGSYALCDFAVGRAAIVYAVASHTWSAPVYIAFGDSGVEVGTTRHEHKDVAWRMNVSLQRPRAAPVIAGIVSDSATGAPVAGAFVELEGAATPVPTDAAGMFTLPNVPPGRRTLTVHRPGYAPRRGDVQVFDDQPTLVDRASVALRPVAQVVGVVTDRATGRPLEDAWLTLMSARQEAVAMARADGAGRFVLTAPAPGSYSVTVRHIGFVRDARGPVDLVLGRPVDVEFNLEPVAVTLDPVTVTGELPVPFLERVGFYERRLTGHGVFLDRAAIEKRGPQDLSHLLMGIPGIRVDRRGAIRLSCYQGRPPLVFLDGVRVDTNEPPGEANLHHWYRMVPPEQLEAVEVYRRPAEMPAQYNVGGEGACGAILLWTRRGGY